MCLHLATSMANMNRSQSHGDPEEKGEEELEDATEVETLARSQHQPSAPSYLQRNLLQEVLNEKRRGLLKSPEVIAFLTKQQEEVRTDRLLHDQNPQTSTSRSRTGHRMGSTSDYMPPRPHTATTKVSTTLSGANMPTSSGGSFPVLVPCGVTLPPGDLPQQLIVQDMLHKLIRTGGLDPNMVPQIVPGPGGQQMLVYVSKSEASRVSKPTTGITVPSGTFKSNPVGQIKIRIPHTITVSSSGSNIAPNKSPARTSSPLNFSSTTYGMPITSRQSGATTTVKSVLPSEISSAPKPIRSASASIPGSISTPIHVIPTHKRTHSESLDDVLVKKETKDKVLAEAQDLDSGSGDLGGDSGSSSQEDTLLPSIWSRGASAFTSVSRTNQPKDKS